MNFSARAFYRAIRAFYRTIYRRFRNEAATQTGRDFAKSSLSLPVSTAIQTGWKPPTGVLQRPLPRPRHLEMGPLFRCLSSAFQQVSRAPR